MATATLEAGQGAVTEVTQGSFLVFFPSTLDPQACRLWGMVRETRRLVCPVLHN